MDAIVEDTIIRHTPLVNYFDAAHSDLRNLIGEAHKKGFSNSYLRGCLYVYAGEGSMGSDKTEGYLSDLKLLGENGKLTRKGKTLLWFLTDSSTAKEYLWAQDLADNKKARSVINKASPFNKK